MSINGISSANSSATVTPASLQQTKRNSSIPPPRGGTLAAKVNVSPQATFFAKLQELQKQDPVKFKEVVKGIAVSLRAAAKKDGASDTSPLTKLADRSTAVTMAREGAEAVEAVRLSRY